MKLRTFSTTIFALACLFASDLMRPHVSINEAVAAVPPGTWRDCEVQNNAAQSTLVTRWNEAALEAICLLDPPIPTLTARTLYMLHAAIYDAWAAFDVDAVPLYAGQEKWSASKDSQSQMAEAISFAALEVLFAELPGQQDIFFDRLAAEGFSEDEFDDPPSGSAAELGIAVGRALLEARLDDGANRTSDFVETSGYVPVNGPVISPH